MRAATLALATVLSATPAIACEEDSLPVCTVVDPTGTPLNVREKPNGKILSTLRRGMRVEVLEHKMYDGKKWARVEKHAEAWGYVLAAYVKCEGGYEMGKICTVADLTGTPLNIRAEPNGTVLGTWDNGVRVRPYDQVTHNGKVWYAVNRIPTDNVIGWVFDPYLKCEEEKGQ